MLFKVGEQVLLKVPPMNGVLMFSKKGKVSLRYINLSKVLDDMGLIAYGLALSSRLSVVKLVFFVSMLKRYHRDGNCIIK